MKKEWKVYIKGVPNRGNEVVKALTDLGGKEPFYNGSYTNENFIFFINHKGEIDYEYLDTEQGQIIMDNYREITLSEKWNDGDLLICHMLSGNRYAVYSDDSELMKCNTITTYVDVDNYTYGINGLFDKDDFKLASNEEYKEFYELLHKHGKDWSDEKKQVVDWKWIPEKWIPEMSNKFYFINIDGKVKVGIHDKETDNVMFNFGNCFKTKEEAEIARDKFKEMLNK